MHKINKDSFIGKIDSIIHTKYQKNKINKQKEEYDESAITAPHKSIEKILLFYYSDNNNRKKKRKKMNIRVVQHQRETLQS